MINQLHSAFLQYIYLYFADNALFDASQYEFFGQNLAEDVELGGLEDGEEDFPTFGAGDDEYHLFERAEVWLQYSSTSPMGKSLLLFLFGLHFRFYMPY